MSNYKLQFPKVLRIEPTSLCNLKCIHCPTGTLNKNRGNMSNDTFSLIVENIKANLDFVKVVVLYHGGEPFLNKDFINMLKTIKDINESIFIKITSNGMLLTENDIKRIIESKLNAIYFSIDGNTPDENNLIRRGADYSKVVKNIKSLIKFKREMGADLPKILVSNVQIVEKILVDEDFNEQTRIDPPEFLLKEFDEELKNNEISLQSLYPIVWPDMDIDPNLFKIQEITGKESNFCDSVINTMTIRWNGDVVPCCYDLTSQEILGNIHENSLDMIWNNDKYIKLRELINKKLFSGICKDCWVVSKTKYQLVKTS